MNVKQVIVMRTDLNCRKGKLAAQVAHASLKVFTDRATIENDQMVVPLTPEMREWLKGTYTKVVLGVDGEEELVRVHELALAAGIPTAIVTDLGLTEFHGVPTKTAVAVGPGDSDAIDLITGPSGLVKTKLL